jgi:hypothetical protein
VAIIKKTSGALVLSFVAVFATDTNCFDNTQTDRVVLKGEIATFSLYPNSKCNSVLGLSLTGSSSIPSFMVFNQTLGSLKVSPADTNAGNFSLTFSVQATYDGMTLSLTNSQVFNVKVP